MNASERTWDAAIIGSGMGGLACAAALSRTGHRVLVLEQHGVAGGQTQVFERNGFTWDVGVHYLGEVAPGGPARHILDWLSEGTIEFASMGAVYDTVHFPGGVEFRFSRPEAALRLDLVEAFPNCTPQIDAFFEAMHAAVHAGRSLYLRRAMPGLLTRLLGRWHEAEIDRWWGRTTGDVLAGLVSDPRLRAVLLTRMGTYGGDPGTSSFGMHAMLFNHYVNGAFYPVGGSRVFAEKLVPVVERAGGEVRVRAHVRELLIEDGRVAGVLLEDGGMVRCPKVVSDTGAHNTVARLLPPTMRDSAWAREILSFEPATCHVALYLGLQGDIRTNGADSSNHWFQESWDIDSGVWHDPAAQSLIPSVFVSFATLKNPGHDPGPDQRHTAEVLVFTDWTAFRPWQDSTLGERPEGYRAFKEAIGRQLLAQFTRHFPALAPMIVCHEISTPLTMVSYIGSEHGAVYGLEHSARRFLSDSLRPRTPVPGLYLAGQDVFSAGVMGAMTGGVFAAAAIDPRVFSHLE